MDPSSADPSISGCANAPDSPWRRYSMLEPSPPPELIGAELERLTRHPIFVRSSRVCRFLELTVRYLLAGRKQELKEYLLGVEVFDRPTGYDPRIDPIVRVEARRVRSKLQDYYRSDGLSDEVVLQYPCGSYVPQVFFRTPGVQKQPPVIAVLPFVPHRPYANGRFADSLTREVIRELNRCRTVRVFSESLERTGQTRVEGLLTGRVAKIADRVRVTAQLLSTGNTQELWSAAFEAEPVNARTAQKQIAFATAHALSTHLSSQASSPASSKEGRHPDIHLDATADARNDLPSSVPAAMPASRPESEALHEWAAVCSEVPAAFQRTRCVRSTSSRCARSTS